MSLANKRLIDSEAESPDWEPQRSEWQEDQAAMEAFAIQQGIVVAEPRIRPNKYLGEH